MEQVKSSPSELPPRLKPGGKQTRYQGVIDQAKAHPGKVYELEGEHHSSNILTLKEHGLRVRSRKGSTKNKHRLWVWFEKPTQS
jgi:hypothetical protein